MTEPNHPLEKEMTNMRPTNSGPSARGRMFVISFSRGWSAHVRDGRWIAGGVRDRGHSYDERPRVGSPNSPRTDDRANADNRELHAGFSRRG